jgi:hypothetical protein
MRSLRLQLQPGKSNVFSTLVAQPVCARCDTIQGNLDSVQIKHTQVAQGHIYFAIRVALGRIIAVLQKNRARMFGTCFTLVCLLQPLLDIGLALQQYGLQFGQLSRVQTGGHENSSCRNGNKTVNDRVIV